MKSITLKLNLVPVTLAIVELLWCVTVVAGATDATPFNAEQDVIGAILQWFFSTIAHLRPSTFTFILRAALLFGVPSALCYWSFLRGCRTLLIQWIWFLAGVLIATTIPAQAISITHPAFKAWVVAISILLLIFLPATLPNFLTPTLGAQRLFRVLNYMGLAVLFIINLVHH